MILTHINTYVSVFGRVCAIEVTLVSELYFVEVPVV